MAEQDQQQQQFPAITVNTNLGWGELPGQSSFEEQNGARIHIGTFTKDMQLSSHPSLSELKLSRFTVCGCGSGQYMVSEALIARMEALVTNFPKIQKTSISSAYRLKQEGDYVSMHNKGCALDIAFFDADGNELNAFYIAPAAAMCGFGGIAPLEKPTAACTNENTEAPKDFYANSIHIDVRVDYGWGCFYFFERDIDKNGWFETHYPNPNISNYGNPIGFYYRYGQEPTESFPHCANHGVTDDTAVFAYLGRGGIRAALKVLVKEALTTSIKFKVLLIGISQVSKVNYTILSVGEEEQTGEITSEIDNTEENSSSFELKNLVPGTAYSIKFELTTPSGVMKPPIIYTCTAQSYPKEPAIEAFTVTKQNGKNTPGATFSFKLDVPTSYECYWEQYNTYNKGVDVELILDGVAVADLTPITGQIYCFKPENFMDNADKTISFGRNLQVRAQTWIETNKKINANEYKVIYSKPVYTRSIYLDSYVPLVDKIFIRDATSYKQVMISQLRKDA